MVDVRTAINARSSAADSVAEHLIRLGKLAADDVATFHRILEERLAKVSDRDAEFQALLKRRVDEALLVVEDPVVCQFLNAKGVGLAMPLLESMAAFRLEHVHSEGGLGQIWLAAEPVTSRQVAIKRIVPRVRSEPESKRRFSMEAKIAGQLQHPNIVPIYHFGTSAANRELFYAMPFIRGRTFEDVINDFHRDNTRQRLDAARLNALLSAFLKICDAISYANAEGIIHRDLKPANVMVGTFGEVFVLDWGLAKALTTAKEELADNALLADSSSDALPADLNDSATRQGSVLGSPLYMAPEQAEGRSAEIDGRTDVYGLGGILYKLATGLEPHVRRDGDSLADHLRRIILEPIPRAKEVHPHVPAALDAICAKALAIKPEDRYASVGALADDVNRLLVGEAVSVYQEPISQTLARWALRHRRVSMAAAVVLSMILVTMTAVFASGWAFAQATIQNEVRSLEQHSLQAVDSIQGDIERAFRELLGLSRRMQLPELLAHRRQGDENGANEWNRIYGPLLDDFIKTTSYFYEMSLFSSTQVGQPEFRLFHVTEGEATTLPNLFDGSERVRVEQALRETDKLPPNGRWCSEVFIVKSQANGEPLPVMLVGTAIYDGPEKVGLLLAMLDFRLPLAFIAANRRISEAITITDRNGVGIFHDVADSDKAASDAYSKVPTVPSSVREIVRSKQVVDSHIDYPGEEDRHLYCVRKVPCLAGQDEPYVGFVLDADYDTLMAEPLRLRRWVAGITLVVIVGLVAVIWLAIRSITSLARG